MAELEVKVDGTVLLKNLNRFNLFSPRLNKALAKEYHSFQFRSKQT
ncbi:MAG: hypothetical protein ACR2OW_14065 [Methyloligellaceae bacterium]